MKDTNEYEYWTLQKRLKPEFREEWINFYSLDKRRDDINGILEKEREAHQKYDFRVRVQTIKETCIREEEERIIE